ncbi:MAG TPA: IclR family transcriptional regulator [Candidatus Binatia bacterium]|nr:IclR family transcriptional regulator [Candidatus Binatia bacterium]
MKGRKTPWATSTTLERACDVLRLFTPQKPRWTISELARHLNVPKSGVFRLVKTFERKHFLQSGDGSYEYELGSEIWELTGTVFGKRERLIEKAAPYLRDLNKTTGLLVSLRVLENEQMVIVDRVEGTDPVKVIFPVGTHQPLNHGAPGKLLIAYHYPPDSTQFHELIARGKITKLTERTLMDRRRLEEELNKIRRLCYATSDGEAIRGTIGIAVPVWNSIGEVEAALALTAVESLCNMKQLMRFLPDLKRTGENISKALGYGMGKSSADSGLLSEL